MTDVRPGLLVSAAVSTAGTTCFELRGVIDDGAPLGALATVTTPRLELDLSGVRRITSFGVRDWIVALRGVPHGVDIVWKRVSVPLVNQLGMIANFAERSKIESFFAPYYCRACDVDTRILLTPDDARACEGRAPVRACPTCGGVLVFDELESDFFAFLTPEVADR